MSEIPPFTYAELLNRTLQMQKSIARNYLQNLSGYHHDVRDIALTYANFYSKMLVNPAEFVKVYVYGLDFMQGWQNAWGSVFTPGAQPSAIEPQPGDKRFREEEWNTIPYFNFIKQTYLLVEKLWMQVVDEVEMDEPARRKLDFYTSQYSNAFSPTNFLLTNPGALKLAAETGGQSLWQGFQNLIKDLEKGKITQVEENAFEVGKDLAITPGSVVFENDLIQLIQYAPVTKKVFSIPLLVIPPWINKYYVLDMKPENSLVRFLTEQGVTVFMVSWRNPKPGMADFSFEDYVRNGALQAIEVVTAISGAPKINTLGYCLGGTLLGIASSVLGARSNENALNSATFLATMLDFSDIGPLGDVIDSALVCKLERGELIKDGVLDGRDMETAFNLIRVNDLVWNYVVNNYLKGITPLPFEAMFWTNDNTNLPAAMYIYYMRNMILENKLSRKNALHLCGAAIDLEKINCPVTVIGFEDDTISPAVTNYTTTRLVSGPVEFILGESGHVMGVVNPPSKKRYGHYLNGNTDGSFEDWKKTSAYVKGSWWSTWAKSLIDRSGKEIPAPSKAGNAAYKVIEPAPGRYVKEKC
ncbi:MAG: PHA/PHB synthase family protein [Bacteroidia bacterium]